MVSLHLKVSLGRGALATVEEQPGCGWSSEPGTGITSHSAPLRSTREPQIGELGQTQETQ